MAETPSPERRDARSTPPPSFVTAVADLLARTGAHLDRLSLDLARDLGEVARGGIAVADAARGEWQEVADTVEAAWTQARAQSRGVPRVTRVVRAGLALAASARWYRLRGAAAGRAGLSDDDHRALAARTRDACIELRGGVLKLGQVASCRPDLIGPVWAAELAQLQDRVPAIDGAAIAARVEAELGAALADRFAGFSADALAAASLAQVHAARLPDGRAVAVKVQVPGIDEIVRADVAALAILAGVLGDLIPGDLGAIAGRQGTALLAAYCTAKHGLVGLTRALAEEWRGEVAVNAICPGSVDTDMLRHGMPGAAPAMTVDDVAAAALFLAADAPTAMTGSCLDVFG